MVREDVYRALTAELAAQGVTLVAVSKTKPAADMQALYDLGQRDFGENYVQELVGKQAELPQDIRWHFIGHLQSNKAKMIVPFVHLIHGVDSFRLLQEIDRQAAKAERVVDVLLQIHIAEEETKFGLDERDVIEFLDFYDAAQGRGMEHIRIRGVMGMATATEDTAQIKAEFERLFAVFRNVQQSYFVGKKYFDTCSMGMSGDYALALEAGSTMVRIGSLLFGSR